jgi:hypothetical protein
MAADAPQEDRMTWRDLGAPTHKPAMRFRDGGWVVDYGEPYPLIQCSSFAWAITIAKMTRSLGLLKSGSNGIGKEA